MVNGENSSGNTYRSSCTAKISPDINLNFGYAFSTVRNLDTGSAPFNNQTFTSQLEIKF
jgi:hypothetical protein